MKAILVISHGSRSSKAKDEVSVLVGSLKDKFSKHLIKYAFLELEEPSIPKGIEDCVNEGATSIHVLLNFLNSGKHVDEDIPAIINVAQTKYPQVTIKVSSPIGQHEKIVDLFSDTIKSTVNND